MNLTEQFFEKVGKSKTFAYIESAEKKESDIPQQYCELIEVLSTVENIPKQGLFLRRGTVTEDQAGYVSAEIGTGINGLTYVYFNISEADGIPIAVLARIYERPLDDYVKNFIKGSSDSRTNNMLKNNQVIKGGMLIEARYIAFCLNGTWYGYRERENGDKLVSSSVDLGADLIKIF